MDPLVTLFSLLSLWCYMRRNNGHSNVFYCFSILSAICAFLTKEMAVSLPPTIFAYALLLQENTPKSSISVTSRLQKTFKSTWPYWLILIVYFCLRKLLLGEFIGGYHNISIESSFSLGRWLNGLQMIVVPLNPAIFPPHSLVSKVWLAVLVALSSLSLIRFAQNKKNTNILGFLIIWFFLSLAPLYKVFPSLMNYATGSRIAYLSTVPLCLFLTYGIAKIAVGNRLSWIARCAVLGCFVLLANVLYVNNLSWAEAGRFTNDVLRVVKAHSKEIHGNSYTYIVGLPAVTDKGVFTGPLLWMTSRPIAATDVFNCLRIEEDSYVSPSFVNKAILAKQTPVRLMYWDSRTRDLYPIKPVIDSVSKRYWLDKDFQTITDVRCSSTRIESHWLNNGTLELVSRDEKTQLAVLNLKLPSLPCLTTDLFAMNIQPGPGEKLEADNVVLQFKNDIVKEYSTWTTCYGTSKKDSGEEQTLYFFLGKLPDWSMGGRCNNVRLILPIKHIIKIAGVYAPKSQSVVPDIDFAVFYGDHAGQLRLGTKTLHTRNIQYDALAISDANSILLEANQIAVIKNGVIDRINVQKSYLFKKQVSGVHGQFVLNKTDFPAEPAIYKAWIQALDKKGNTVGFPTDYFFIRTDY